MRRGEQVISTGRAGSSLGTWKLQGLNQTKLVEPHVFHCTGRGTYIAGVTGINQNNTRLTHNLYPPHSERHRGINIAKAG
jgi:hypothetical protein